MPESLPASENPAPPPVAATPPDETTGAKGRDLLQVGPDDLKLIRGYITRKGGAIRTTSESSAFNLPADFPEKYALEADVIRQSGTNGICFGFTAFEQPLTAVIDGFYSTKSGLASINDQEIFTEGNPQVKSAPVLTTGQPATIRIEVSPDAVRLAVDQDTIAAWTYDPQAKLRSARGMQGGDLDRLHVFTWEAAYTITRLELLPLP